MKNVSDLEFSLSLSDILPQGYTGIDYLMIFIWICIMIVMAYLAYTKG